MTGPLDWKSLYSLLPEGLFALTAKVLENLRPDRIIETVLGGQPAKALLLDKPFKLGTAFHEGSVVMHYLTRIRIRDMVGWPPRIASEGDQPWFPGALACCLRSVANKGDHLEFELECRQGVFKAWQRGCPPPLLRCAEATLKQEGVLGRKLSEIQEMRLIGAE